MDKYFSTLNNYTFSLLNKGEVIITNISGQFMPKTYIEISVLLIYSLIFGISVYIFSVHIFDVRTSRPKLPAATTVKAARTNTIGIQNRNIMQYQNSASIEEPAKSPHGLQRKPATSRLIFADV